MPLLAQVQERPKGHQVKDVVHQKIGGGDHQHLSIDEHADDARETHPLFRAACLSGQVLELRGAHRRMLLRPVPGVVLPPDQQQQRGQANCREGCSPTNQWQQHTHDRWGDRTAEPGPGDQKTRANPQLRAGSQFLIAPVVTGNNPP